MANKKNGCLTIIATLLVLVGFLIQQFNRDDRPEDVAAPDRSVVGRHLYGGAPKTDGYPNTVKTLQRQGFVVGYDERRGSAAWVAYRLAGSPKFDSGERPRHFTIDDETESRVRSDDYTRSGYDRGHLAPNYGIATRYGRDAQIETFKMTNIIPQSPGLNRGLWRALEERIASDDGLAETLEEVWIITGPLFGASPKTLPRTGIAIPDACYKIVIDEINGKPRAMGFVFPQDIPRSAELERFLVPIDAIESRAMLDFLAALPDRLERTIESHAPEALW
ncbi:MAG: DNA/RNA non-specific endonuclease [Myxococcota bacterium]